jgi:hypothetical protein
VRGIPNSAEDHEARDAIERRRDGYERMLELAVKEILDGARVF